MALRILLVLLSTYFLQTGDAGTAELKLFNSLLGRKSGYNEVLRPIANSSAAIKVSFGVSLVEILSLKESNSRISIRLHLVMQWRDRFLRWAPKEYGRVHSLRVPANLVWKPDITLSNGEMQLDDKLNVIVYPDGTVTWVVPALASVGCKHEFRTDSWICVFDFNSWSYDGSLLDIKPIGDSVAMDMEFYQANDHWGLVSANGDRTVRQFTCCTEPFVTMQYVLKMRTKIGHPMIRRR